MSKKSKKIFAKIKDKYQKNVMIASSIMIIVLLLISSTVAWFVLRINADIDAFNSQVSQWDFIVSTQPDAAAPIRDGDEIPVFMDSVVNVANGRIAPGSTGSFKLYISSSTDVVSAYSLMIDKSQLLFSVPQEVLDSDETGLNTSDLTDLFAKHIFFYSDSEFTNEIDTAALVGDIPMGEEVEVTVYWKWPYEGTHLLENVTADELENGYTPEHQAILDKYDDEDMLISRYRQYISGSIGIITDGVQAQP